MNFIYIECFYMSKCKCFIVEMYKGVQNGRCSEFKH